MYTNIMYMCVYSCTYIYMLIPPGASAIGCQAMTTAVRLSSLPISKQRLPRAQNKRNNNVIMHMYIYIYI